ncbi:MAG: NAD(P)-binding domain-containing protein [candidate division KSB1 bacterium]
MPTPLPLLIIGAGPFGLALSAYAKRMRIEHVIIGKPMGFWKEHMPAGMYLRSDCEWHYDPFNEHTILRYLETQQLKPEDVEPLTLAFYLGYAEWFQKQKGIEALPALVQRLDFANGCFEASLTNKATLAARNVALALGFRYFKNIPEPFPTLFPAGRFAHTCDFVDFAPLRNKRVLIIGGRQSAFEWAALIREHGAEAVYMSYRHATPSFEVSDWSWEKEIVDNIAHHPRWFRDLSEAEKEQLHHRLWAEGRLKLEPWLAQRIVHEQIKLFPHSQVTACRELPNGELEVRVNETSLRVDQIIIATGYKVNVAHIPLLAQGNLLARLATKNGFPVLDEHFQSNIPGLFFTSMCATQDFGPFFAFTAAVRASAKLIGEALSQRVFS